MVVLVLEGMPLLSSAVTVGKWLGLQHTAKDLVVFWLLGMGRSRSKGILSDESRGALSLQCVILISGVFGSGKRKED